MLNRLNCQLNRLKSKSERNILRFACFFVRNNKIENITLECSIQKTTDLLLSELMKGEADLAIVPSNLALQVYKKDLGYDTKVTIVLVKDNDYYYVVECTK